MSIIIKGMDMPNHCYECLLRQGNCCLLLYEAIPPTVPLTRLVDCPLIEVDENEIAMLANAYLEKEKADGNIEDFLSDCEEDERSE